MLDNTRKAFAKVKRDISIIGWFFHYCTHILTIITLVVLLFLRTGNIIANACLLIISALFLFFQMVYGKKELSKKDKKIAKKKLNKASHVLTISQIVVKAYSLGVIFYTMLIASNEISPITIVLTTLMIILWVLSFVMEIVKLLFEFEKDRIIDGFNQDFEWVEKTKNFVNAQASNVKEFVDGKVEQAKGFVNKVLHKDDKKSNND